MLAGQPVELPEGEISLGRSRSCTVPLKDPSVSRSHALLMIRDGEVSLRDLNSSNGTFVNGARLAAELTVQDGDRILFGETEAILRIVPPPENPLATVHVDLDSLFCESCKAPFPAHLMVCTNCGARRGDSPPSRPGITTPAAMPAFSGTGSRQVLASAPVAAAPPAAPPPAAQLTGTPVTPTAPAAAAEVLSPISGWDETIGPGGVVGAKPEERSHATAPRSLPGPGAVPARPGTGARVAVPRPQGGTLGPAGFWIRFAAWVLDSLWMAALAAGAAFAAGGITSPTGQWVAPAVYLGLGLLVPVLGWGLFGTTPGKRLLGLFVGPVQGGVGIGVGRALLRWIGAQLSMVVLGIGYLLIGFSNDKRGLHDHLAGTMVGRKR